MPLRTSTKKNNEICSFGFTLVETLVAISMLSIVIAGVMSAIQVTLKSTAYAKDEVTAKFLAEEGVESIRNMRDFNVINNSPWMTNIADSSSAPCGDVTNPNTSNSCTVDPINQKVSQCSSGGAMCTTPLNYDSATGEYSYGTGGGTLSASKFTRTIQVTGADISGGTAYSAHVIVTVTWPENTATQTYSVSEYLFNWYSNSNGSSVPTPPSNPNKCISVGVEDMAMNTGDSNTELSSGFEPFENGTHFSAGKYTITYTGGALNNDDYITEYCSGQTTNPWGLMLPGCADQTHTNPATGYNYNYESYNYSYVFDSMYNIITVQHNINQWPQCAFYPSEQAVEVPSGPNNNTIYSQGYGCGSTTVTFTTGTSGPIGIWLNTSIPYGNAPGNMPLSFYKGDGVTPGHVTDGSSAPTFCIQAD